MDIFSLGCIIAEILMDGEALFDHASLLAYKKGAFDPNVILNSKVADNDIKEMILSMISIKPEERMSAMEYMRKYKFSVFPITFYITIYPLMSYLALPIMASADMKITHIFKHISYIWGMIYSSDFPIIYDYANHEIFEKGRFSVEVPLNDKSEPSIKEFNDDNIMKVGMSYENKKDSIYIIMKVILTQIWYAKFSSTIVVGMKLLRIISQSNVFYSIVQSIMGLGINIAVLPISIKGS
jgi:serine/threonine protein kinase